MHAAKGVSPALAFVTEVCRLVAQGACRNYRNALSRWLNTEAKAGHPVFEKKNRTGAASFLAASGWQPRNYSEQLQTPGDTQKPFISWVWRP